MYLPILPESHPARFLSVFSLRRRRVHVVPARLDGPQRSQRSAKPCAGRRAKISSRRKRRTPIELHRDFTAQRRFFSSRF
jgi:hypothetical protein